MMCGKSKRHGLSAETTISPRKQTHTCLSVQFPTLRGRTNRLTTIKSTAHIWLENVAFYTESNKSVVGLVPISHMDLFKHAPIHISPIRVYKKSLCSNLSPSNPSLYLPTTCRDIGLSLITLRSLRLQFLLCSSPLGEENYLWTFWLTLYGLLSPPSGPFSSWSLFSDLP